MNENRINQDNGAVSLKEAKESLSKHLLAALPPNEGEKRKTEES